jgi:hypothetical protein
MDVLFIVEMICKFFRAYKVRGKLITDFKSIAGSYKL